jgi:predicted membrane protein
MLGIPLGNILTKMTKEEISSIQKWIKLIFYSAIVLAILFVFLGNDAILFTLLFIAIVTSRSLFFSSKKSKKK